MNTILKEHKNFLSEDEFKKLTSLILHEDFPWRIREEMTPDMKKPYFTYSFFNELSTRSEFYLEYIVPILKKLDAKSVIQVRANLNISALYEKSGWHTDYTYFNGNKTAIFYLNTCGGGTEFKINDKTKLVKPEENKMIVFPCEIEHRAVSTDDVNRRYILNINYF